MNEKLKKILSCIGSFFAGIVSAIIYEFIRHKPDDRRGNIDRVIPDNKQPADEIRTAEGAVEQSTAINKELSTDADRAGKLIEELRKRKQNKNN